MPELPEVETVVRGLRPDLVGRTFTDVRVEWPREIHMHSPQELTDRLQGQRIEALGRRAKYIVFDLTHDTLLIHLKMSGRLYVADTSVQHPDDHWARVVFQLDNGRELRFSDARKFGRVYLVANMDDVVGKLGPEPLEDTFTLDEFKGRVAKRHTTIKPLLLNQEFIAGVGNIYADEALWRARIDPRRKTDTLSEDEIARLYDAVRESLELGIAYHGSTLSTYRQPDGSKGGYQNRFVVYDQTNKPCSRCGTPISKIWLGQRGTHFCPHCQE